MNVSVSTACQVSIIATAAYIVVLYIVGLTVTWRAAYRQRPSTPEDHLGYDAKASDAMLCGVFWPFLMLGYIIGRWNGRQ